ncbi:MAG: FAD-binding oxidoreductase [Clostridiales bacterium]|nr:FAD-binding oxidoreductase [Clostridiales bacterium]
MSEVWISELKSLLGETHVSGDPLDLEWATYDFTGDDRLGAKKAWAQRPLAVVWPGSTEEVAEVLRWAEERKVPLVPRGGGTGVMGGAVPLKPSVVVDLSRLDDIAVHAENLLVEAGAGARLGDVQRALRPYGLMVAHDPWSQGIASVGGAISTDGVGYLAGRFGSMGQQVVALEAVLPGGRIIRTRLSPKPSAGPDLRALFIGSQGTFGIITRAWIRVIPLPETMIFRTYRFRGFEPGFRAIVRLWREGVVPDLLDFGDDTPEEQEVSPGFEDEEGRTGILHLGFFGLKEEAWGRFAAARRLLEEGEVRDEGEEPARRFWEERHALAEEEALPILKSRDPVRRAQMGHLEYLNLALPIGEVLPYRREALDLLKGERAFRAGETGIWGRPEVFSLLILPRDGETYDREGFSRLLEELLRRAQRRGAAMEYIHGTGVKLLPLLKEEWGPSLEVIHRLKKALDPSDLLNPGKWGEGQDF